MSQYRDDAVAACQAGRAANPGDANPYRGMGVLADLWLIGYKAMLLDRFEQSPSRQPFLAADNTQ